MRAKTTDRHRFHSADAAVITYGGTGKASYRIGNILQTECLDLLSADGLYRNGCRQLSGHTMSRHRHLVDSPLRHRVTLLSVCRGEKQYEHEDDIRHLSISPVDIHYAIYTYVRRFDPKRLSIRFRQVFRLVPPLVGCLPGPY